MREKKRIMKKLIILSLACCILAACHESLEDRAARECKEFTEKNCPQRLQNGMIYDSLVFEPQSRTIHHYYTITGAGDNPEVFRKKKGELHKAEKESIESDVSTKTYRDRGFRFKVTVRSQKNQGMILFNETF